MGFPMRLNRGSPSTLPSTADHNSSMELDRVRSRERAVSRVFKGVVVSGIGWVANIMTTAVLEFVFGASQSVQEVWAIGARSLMWLGFFVAASAGTHLLRFGGRRGQWAFASVAAAGACGLLAVAEQFETWFLDTHYLRGLDVWGLAGVVLFMVLAGILIGGDAVRGDPGEQGEA